MLMLLPPLQQTYKTREVRDYPRIITMFTKISMIFTTWHPWTGIVDFLVWDDIKNTDIPEI